MAAVASLRESRLTSGDLNLLWIGSVGGIEVDIVNNAGIDIEIIYSGGVVGRGFAGICKGLWKVMIGTMQAWPLMSNFKPTAIFVTGGYTAIPVVLCGWLRRIPVAIYLPDVEPGLAVRVIARIAKRVLITAETSRQFFDFKKNETIVTGYPLRPKLLRDIQVSTTKARQHFGINCSRKTILVVGGSLGARSINMAVVNSVNEWVDKGVQVIHITGKLGWIEVQTAWSGFHLETKSNYRIFPYIYEDMGLALRAADLVVARSGASCLGEFPAFGLPAILVPYPYSWRYQYSNAQLLSNAGAAICIEDKDLMSDLTHMVTGLVDNISELNDMSKKAKGLSKTEGSVRIAEEIISMASEVSR